MDAHPLGAALGNFLEFVPGQRGLAAYVVFIAASGAFGACVVLLDACSASLGGRSALGLTLGWQTTSKALTMWFIGASIAGGLGMVARIFEPTPLAALLAAISWRTFLTKLLEMDRENRQHGAGTNGG